MMNSALIALACLLVCTFLVLLFIILSTQTCQGSFLQLHENVGTLLWFGRQAVECLT